jgi:hypothetical protein
MNAQEVIASHGVSNLTTSVIGRLEQSVDAYAKGQRDVAIERLRTLGPDVTTLHDVTEQLRERAATAAKNQQRLSERVSILIGIITRTEAQLRNEIASARGDQSRSASQVASLASSIGDLQAEMARNRAEIASITARYEETAKWWWVPGYGSYLVGRAAVDTIDGKLAALQVASSELQRLNRDKSTVEAQAVSAREALATIERAIADSSHREADLAKQQATLEAQNKLLANKEVFAMNVSQFYRLLSRDLEGIVDNLGHLASIARRLDENEVAYDKNGNAETISLKQGLLRVAGQADAYRPASGEAVHHVDFGLDGRELGSFVQIGPKTWAERSPGQTLANFSFNETGRDEWSVYLRDPSRNVSLQLDLWTNRVYYTDSNTPRREQYHVLGASDTMTGWLVSVVDFAAAGASKLGSFVSVGAKQWNEVQGSRTVATFSETHRDDWSVYMFDGSRSVSIQLDLWTRRVYYTDATSARRELYVVLGAS